MKTISIYVHDLFLEIGHSNVTIDTLKHLPNQENISVKFVVFTHDKIENLFPNSKMNISFHKLPIRNIKPTLLKIIFYQIYSFFYSLFCDHSEIKISLGISNFLSNHAIIHFIHEQWSEKYFKILPVKGARLIYKRILFGYLNTCEFLFFRSKKRKIITVSNFLRDFLVEKYSLSPKKVVSIHSAFNSERFSPIDISELQKGQLIDKYPTLRKINFDLPVNLFIGAFERKGLDLLLEIKNKNDQFIIIGVPEGRDRYELNKKDNIAHIPYTKEIQFFYALSDHFIFPTVYEPFGMVLIEAATMGLQITTTKDSVGAIEILENIPKITAVKKENSFSYTSTITKITFSEKVKLSTERKRSLSVFTWENQSKKYYDFIFPNNE